MTDETTQTTEAPAQPQAQLQLSDILLAAQTIQVASSRGAFKVEEFTQIGGLYERLLGFLQASGALTPAQPAEAAPEAPAEETQGN
jgi:hypothetical protein